MLLEVSNDGGVTFTNVAELTPVEFPVGSPTSATYIVDVSAAVEDVVVQLRIEPGKLAGPDEEFEVVYFEVLSVCDDFIVEPEL